MIERIDNLWERGEHLLYKDIGKIKLKAKTHIFEVISKYRGIALGRVKWYGKWRQYVLEPLPGMIFDTKCLTELSEYCNMKTANHRAKIPYPRDIAHRRSLPSDVAVMVEGDVGLTAKSPL